MTARTRKKKKTRIQRIRNSFEQGPAGRAPCAGGGHFVTCNGLRMVLSLVAVRIPY